MYTIKNELENVKKNFFLKSKESLDIIQNYFFLFEQERKNTELINKALDILEAIKENSKLLNFYVINELLDSFENIFSQMRSSKVAVDDNFIEILFEIHDFLVELFKCGEFDSKEISLELKETYSNILLDLSAYSPSIVSQNSLLL